MSLDSGHELATISPDGVLTAEGWENGEIVVRATSVLSPDVYDYCTITKSGFVVSSSDFIQKELIDIHYNNSKLYISGCSNTGKVLWSIVDLSGREFRMPVYHENGYYIIDVNTLNRGIYILKVSTLYFEKQFRFIR